MNWICACAFVFIKAWVWMMVSGTLWSWTADEITWASRWTEMKGPRLTRPSHFLWPPTVSSSSAVSVCVYFVCVCIGGHVQINLLVWNILNHTASVLLWKLIKLLTWTFSWTFLRSPLEVLWLAQRQEVRKLLRLSNFTPTSTLFSFPSFWVSFFIYSSSMQFNNF